MSFYLIDFENVGEAGFNGIEKLQKEDTVIVFYSKNSCKKISIDIFGKNVHHAEIRFIKAEVGTKNALDFQLVSYLGFLARDTEDDEPFCFLTKDTADKKHFCIISQDNGYSPLVTFWKQYDVSVKLAVDLAGNTVPVAEPKKKVKAEKVKTEKKKNDSELQKENQMAYIKNAVSKVLKKKEEKGKIAKVVEIVVSSKTKSELNAKLTGYLKDGRTVSEVIKSVKPFLKLK